MSENKDPPAEEADAFIFLSKMAKLMEDLEPLAKNNKNLKDRIEEAKLLLTGLAGFQLQVEIAKKLDKLVNRDRKQPDPPAEATPDPEEAEKQHQLNVEFLKGLALTARKSGDFIATRQNGSKLEMVMRIPKVYRK